VNDDRLRRILDALERSEAGGHQAHPGVTGDDDIGRIAGAIDVLLSRVQMLEQANADLGARVAEHKAALDAASRELDAFSYSVSHDLKAPLRGIDGYARILLEDYGGHLDAEGGRLLGKLVSGVERMNRLIGDVLDYSRLERRALVPVVVDLQSHVEQLVAGIGALSNSGSGKVTADMAGLRVRADPASLALVLRKLLDNALKFGLPGEAPVVHVSASRAGSAVAIEVRDRGIGFDMRYHDRIFDMFQRLHRAEDYPGTGAGLALVKRAVTRMGGRVCAESAPGEGACFRVELPSS
jgi:signal transduction histidine kinase